MKKIVISISIIVAVAAVVFGATTAFFSDTETSEGNTISAGTIDILVDGQNPWSKTYSQELSDMKPSQTRWIEFTVKNRTNSNPVVVWKHIHVTEQSDGEITEPECTEGGGTWVSNACSENGYNSKNNLKPYIIYDMEVDGTTLIPEDWDVRLSDVDSIWIPLGELGVGEQMIVRQSYHLAPETGNWAQGDIVTFDIDIYAEQLLGGGPGPTTHGLVLENKDASWNPIIDGKWGLLTYKYSSSTFDYNFKGFGLNSTTNYSLIYYADPWTGSNPGALIGSGTTDASGNLILSGTQNLGMDLPDPNDANYPTGAKIWLVLSADYTAPSMTGWNQSEYLYESNLIKYDDADI